MNNLTLFRLAFPQNINRPAVNFRIIENVCQIHSQDLQILATLVKLIFPIFFSHLFESRIYQTKTFKFVQVQKQTVVK